MTDRHIPETSSERTGDLEPTPVVISLGSLNVDFQVRAARAPEPGEALLAQDFALLGGGKGANVAYLVQSLGQPALLLAHVGDDALAPIALGFLREAGIALTHVRTVPHSATGAALIAVRPDAQKAVLLAPNANERWGEPDLQRMRDVIHTQPEGSVLVVDLEVGAPAAELAVQTARARGFRVVVDPSPAERVSDDLLARADVITPNASEARHLLGDAHAPDTAEAAERAGRRLLERGVRAAYVKLPGGGCVLVTERASTWISRFEVDAVDSTGAGDAFAGALGVGLLEHMSLEAAGRFAVGAASLAVTRYGSVPAYPDRVELERLLGAE